MLADVPSTPEIDADVAKLLEQRKSAETELIGLMLALGHHQQVVADLRRIVTADPLAEHSWAQLMIALYRSGRRGEALAAYSKARAALISSLGTEPGLELQELLADILSDSRRLSPPAPPAAEFRARSLDWVPRGNSSPARAAPDWPPASSALALLAACA
jgi:DNA-binding SARP family transcriptional activator